MFIDKAEIKCQAGHGGDGAVAWRREKYEPAGGPAGGDGGKGGDVIVRTDPGLHTLMDFRYSRIYKAENGQGGMNKLKYGRKGQDVVLRVPVGTLIKDKETGGVIADLKEPNAQFTVCKGGKGGKGNAKFRSSTRQAPSFAEAGTRGEARDIILELKLLADVGLVGFPNVGKSTLLSVVSAAEPKIANYHFTTLEPNLGVVQLGDERSFVLADIPGLIEGASQGIGLGDEFLKHVERTKLLIHVIDASGSEGRDPIEDFELINQELKGYNEKLATKSQLIFLNKMDLPESKANAEAFRLAYPELTVFEGSAAMNANVRDLMNKAYNELQAIETEDYETYDVVYVDNKERKDGIEVYEEHGDYHIDGPYIDKLLRSTNFGDHESLRYFQENLRKNGVIDKLKDLGVGEGDSVFIGEYEFEFFE
ncbi:GTPase ObgE [Peptoniphilus equinus]|uniref:GTPase Obg n=1 Tax=Peptoniphilus equinus TaxID=3016343 RepID=A0ABY7QT12_9FIRM|nr:GTPase ObgE [Peptoniphilus equinus]WBW49214.1 GTPase ObgE [Peptoniphilus equinus]